MRPSINTTLDSTCSQTKFFLRVGRKSPNSIIMPQANRIKEIRLKGLMLVIKISGANL